MGYRTLGEWIAYNYRTFWWKMSDSSRGPQDNLKSDRTMSDGRRQSESLGVVQNVKLTQIIPSWLLTPIPAVYCELY